MSKVDSKSKLTVGQAGMEGNKNDKVSIPKRCEFLDCKRKLSLVAFPCKCSKYYCLHHTVPESHLCNYDYFGEHQKNLLKVISAPIVAAKITSLD